ncbi:hypothetical protein [Gordonia amicalis]|uniref:hypothetical protein n=1 Tax=Gordonia amicalis TaxID=89053 RepID=UPI003A80CBBD
MTDDIISWPRVSDGQRLYICRPMAKSWREALRDYYAVERGSQPQHDIWDVSDWNWRAGDLLLTYMQTNPMMIVHLDRLTTDGHNSHQINWAQYCHFTRGVPLDLVADTAGVGHLTSVDPYLDTTDARRIVAALRREYESGASVFGDNRIVDLI